jgi:predicted dehydrogenase
VHQQRRWEAAFQKVKEVIDSGILGNVYEVNIEENGSQNRDDWQTLSEFGGGQLLNWGPHIIDHSLRFCGGAYTDMYSAIRHVAAAGDCEDHIKIVFTGVNGRIVDMEISGGAALPTPEYRIYGSRGALVSEKNSFKLRYLDPAVELEPVVADPETPGVGTSFGNKEALPWIEETVDAGNGGTDRVWDALYDSIRFGVKYPIALSEAAAVTEVIEKVKASTIFENK